MHKMCLTLLLFRYFFHLKRHPFTKKVCSQYINIYALPLMYKHKTVRSWNKNILTFLVHPCLSYVVRPCQRDAFCILWNWVFPTLPSLPINIEKYSVLETSKRSEGSKGFKESKKAGNKKGYRMALNGNIKGYQRTRCKKGLLWHKYAQRWKSK